MKTTVLKIGILSLGIAALAAIVVAQTRKSAPAAISASSEVVQIPAPARRSLADAQIAKLEKMVREHPAKAELKVQLGDVLMQKARETADSSYYSLAEKSYEAALTIEPKRVDATIGIAWVAGGRHEFEKSIEWANRAIALKPDAPEPYGLLGDADVEMGNYDQAFQHYQKMLDLRPGMSSYSRSAHLLAITGDTRKALWLMDKASRTGAVYNENSAWCRAQMAQMLFNTGNYRAARMTLEDALVHSKNDFHLHAMMGRVLAALQDIPGAIKHYERAVEAAPQIEVVAALGDLYQLTGRKADAEKQFALVEAMHKINKSNGVLGDSAIARFYADHDRNLPEALKMAQAEYATRKGVYTTDTLAWCLYKNGNYAEAKEVIAKALDRKTPDPMIKFHAGMIEAKLGNRAVAQKHLYSALSESARFSPVFAPVAESTLKELGSRVAGR